MSKSMENCKYVLTEKWFVGSNYEYYKQRWENKTAGKLYLSWNWAGFFLGISWMFYRKMYLEVSVALTIILIFIFFPFNLGVYEFLAGTLKIIMALFGNAFYHFRFKRVIDKTKTLTKNEANDYIQKHSGTSILAAILFQCVATALCFLF
ncbi:DUF2628 domain-containing protein [Oscillospiraceae bacterium PP1C4]